MGVQSVVFPKKHFTLREANDWIKKHNYKLTHYGKKVHITPTQFRFRQTSPLKYKKYRTARLKNHVQLIVGIK